MSTALRMSITLTAPQVAFLRAEADRLGIPVADLIRRIIDAHREQREGRRQAVAGKAA